jgi:VanZ family protein
MALIFIASGTQGSDLPSFGTWDLFAKKGGHMCGYAMLAFAFMHALNKGGKPARGRLLAAAALACLYAMTDEFHQKFTPGRTSSIIDVGIDTAGAVLGLAIWGLLKSRKSAADRQQAGLRTGGL